ncbi:MAG TPA: hypothetical protein VGO00_10810 [Kofleriaceae bacterium]|nr:hypothetical protein [Kofleriaceae bacterium]
MTMAIGVLAVVGLLLLIFVYRPRQVNSAARDEIDAWDARWLAARSCLVGDKPEAASLGQAFAIRELQHAVDVKKCKPLMKLWRNSNADSGLDDVEAAWKRMSVAVQKLNDQYAVHNSNPARADLKLPVALDAVEGARGQLRTSAGMPVAPSLGPALQTAEVVSLANGKDPVVSLEPFVPSAHGGVAFGKTAAGSVEVVLTAGGAPLVATVVDGEVRSTADFGFGALAEMGRIRIGKFDAFGAFAGEPQQIAMPGHVSVLVAAGTQAAGVVVYGIDAMVVARRTAGADSFVSAKPVELANIISTVDPVTNRAAIAWTDHAGKLSGQMVSAGDVIVDLGSTGDPQQMCLTADRAYVMTTGALVPFADTAQPSQLVANSTLRGCSPNAAVIQTVGVRDAFSVCSDTCRMVKLPDLPIDNATVVINRKLVAVAAHDGVIGLYREDRPPSFVAARVTGVVNAITDGKLIDVIAQTPEGLAIARIASP